MTAYEIVYLTFTGLQVLVAIGGFIMVWRSLRFLAQQTRVLSESVEETACLSVGDRQIEIDRIFIEWPGLRKYFLEGIQISRDDTDYEAALATAQLLANYFETYFLQRRAHSQLYSESTWLEYINDHLSNSPILRQFILGFREWYTNELVEAARAAELNKGLLTEIGVHDNPRSIDQ